jgi:hypothetical protein
MTLDALRFQRHHDFEVVIVEGPSDVGWGKLASDQHQWVRRVRCEEENLARSRNLGVAAASGEIVAFIDDDAVPEPHWLAELALAYDDERVAGAGGLVLDHTGIRPQFEQSSCDRVGRTCFERQMLARETRPGADPFPYLQGTNMSFRRDTLVAIGGFDEHLLYVYDDVDICLRMIDSGVLLRPLDGAVVHHRCLASPVRRTDGFILDPFTLAEGRAYFALRHGPSAEDARQSLRDFAHESRQTALTALANGGCSETEIGCFMARLDAGLLSGSRRAVARPAARPTLPERDPAAFCPYPLLGRRPPMRVCLISSQRASSEGSEVHVDAELEPEAARLAAQGHEVHILTDAPIDFTEVEFDGAVWIHKLAAGDRCLASLADEPFASDLYGAAANYHEVSRLHTRAPVDAVIAPAGHPGSLICSLDRRYPTVTRLLADAGAFDGAGEPVDVDELAAVLADVTESAWPSASRAAAELLDSRCYPLDLPAAVLRAWEAPAARFTEVVFLSVLGREPDEHARAAWCAHISGGHSRHDLLEGVLCSAEARARGVPPDTLDRFQRRLAAWAPVQLSRGWTLSDRAFVHVAYQWTLGRPPDPEHGPQVLSRLECGATRLDVVAELSNSAEAQAHGMPASLLDALRDALRVRRRLSATATSIVADTCVSAL